MRREFRLSRNEFAPCESSKILCVLALILLLIRPRLRKMSISLALVFRILKRTLPFLNVAPEGRKDRRTRKALPIKIRRRETGSLSPRYSVVRCYINATQPPPPKKRKTEPLERVVTPASPITPISPVLTLTSSKSKTAKEAAPIQRADHYIPNDFLPMDYESSVLTFSHPGVTYEEYIRTYPPLSVC